MRYVPLDSLADAIDERTSLVAFSLVQSADGRIADLPAVTAAAAAAGARTFVDVTQAAGWLPFDARGVDFSVCSGYKWLCGPRGTAFFTVRASLRAELSPVNAGWYAGESVWESVYGPGMHLASSARRFDISPAWLSWLGAVPALELLCEIGVENIHDHNVALANALRDGLGLPPSDSAIVALHRRGRGGAPGGRGHPRGVTGREGAHGISSVEHARRCVGGLARAWLTFGILGGCPCRSLSARCLPQPGCCRLLRWRSAGPMK